MSHDWSVRVRTDSSSGVIATARNHAWPIGQAITFAPKDESPSALEVAVGALGADLIATLRHICRLRRIPFDQAEFSLRCELDNPLTYVAVIGEEGTPAISKIDGVLYVSSFDEEEVRDAWEETLRRSPLYTTLKKAAEVSLRLAIAP